MTAISDWFKNLSRNSECALIPFISACDPSLETTAEALQVLNRSGADIIELGVPYSDPLADRPVIQAAATRALQKGTKADAAIVGSAFVKRLAFVNSEQGLKAIALVLSNPQAKPPNF